LGTLSARWKLLFEIKQNQFILNTYVMQRLIGLILLFAVFTSYSQLPDKQLLYVNGGFSIGNLFGGQIGINFAVDNKFSIQAEYSGVVRNSKATPDDYFTGVIGLFTFGASNPKDGISSFRLMAGKLKAINSTGTIRINFKGGLSYLTIKEPYNFNKGNGFLIDANYTWDYISKHQFGLILKPEVEFVFSNYIGAAVTPYFELTSNFSIIGIGFNLLLGKLRIKQ